MTPIRSSSPTFVDFIDSLPEEIAVKIFNFLDITSLMRSSTVNHTWKRIARDHTIHLNKTILSVVNALKTSPINLGLNFTTKSPRDLDLWFGPDELLVTSLNSLHQYKRVGKKHKWKTTIASKGLQVLSGHYLLNTQISGAKVLRGKNREFVLGQNVITGSLLPNEQYTAVCEDNTVKVWDLKEPVHERSNTALEMLELNKGPIQFAFGYWLVSYKMALAITPRFSWHLFDVRTLSTTVIEEDTQDIYSIYEGLLIKKQTHRVETKHFSNSGVGEVAWSWSSNNIGVGFRLATVQINTSWVLIEEQNSDQEYFRGVILDKKTGEELCTFLYNMLGFSIIDNKIMTQDGNAEALPLVDMSLKLDGDFIFLSVKNQVHTFHIPIKKVLPMIELASQDRIQEVSLITKNKFYESSITVLASRFPNNTMQMFHSIFQYIINQ